LSRTSGYGATGFKSISGTADFTLALIHVCGIIESQAAASGRL
jgi:hypothetical protein